MEIVMPQLKLIVICTLVIFVNAFSNNKLDNIIQESIQTKSCPGAVVLIGTQDKIIYHKAFGLCTCQPTEKVMSIDTLFDIASLTKIFTALSIMMLYEEKKLALTDCVAQYFPAFGCNGKENITIEQLLRHRSGLQAIPTQSDFVDGKDQAIANICNSIPANIPNTKFVYSDLNFIILGWLVEKISNQTLDSFCTKKIFEPLGMHETSFCLSSEKRALCAPCDKRDKHDKDYVLGIVHDPRALLLHGVAGHAGIFSTSQDLARFCQMMLNKGMLDTTRILQPETITLMTSTAQNIPLDEQRGLGWDINTWLSSMRGDLFPIGSFGHSGFTGCSFWIDPQSKTYVIILTNRLHPDGPGQNGIADVRPLRNKLATEVAKIIGYTKINPIPPRPTTLPT